MNVRFTIEQIKTAKQFHRAEGSLTPSHDQPGPFLAVAEGGETSNQKIWQNVYSSKLDNANKN